MEYLKVCALRTMRAQALPSSEEKFEFLLKMSLSSLPWISVKGEIILVMVKYLLLAIPLW